MNSLRLLDHVHPGICLSALFDMNGIRREHVARLLQVSPITVNKLFNGRCAVSEEMAHKFQPVVAAALHITLDAREIIAKQATWDRDEKARQRQQHALFVEVVNQHKCDCAIDGTQ